MEMIKRSSEILRSIFGVLSSGISMGESNLHLAYLRESTAANGAFIFEARVVPAAGSRKGQKGNGP